ncbi:type IV pilus modification PilV family protein [Rhodoferax antarcticus]|uniref:Prepilin-type N-terminal cleavage/methylation domain protein n=1 Tax=Rhodoferax antarcticus ANT.BR TaxID=1111071 RepID=A0A1Q8YEB9_9BURK|nr:prepilin-type N-terminal cleavage/methylation domain-containing protein [Rhodoferax antarcticus]APW46190.1 hypothetical protein RA876_07190 [Rhodoferax antarcticus]OLP06383.1 prepilin-type N-terminal cleavage/methylation domain protein [Rhodoferax antarcticus ANT.BR]
MSSNRPRQTGFTLIELIIFIVVVSAGLAGILSVMNTTVKSSADPMVRKQAIAIAESLLEEILLKDYCDPDTVTAGTPPTCGTYTVEASRSLYDDVKDYAGYSTTSGIVDLVGDAIPGLALYNIAGVTVGDSTDLTGVAAKKITVSVSGPAGTISLSGYRANY